MNVNGALPRNRRDVFVLKHLDGSSPKSHATRAPAATMVWWREKLGGATKRPSRKARRKKSQPLPSPRPDLPPPPQLPLPLPLPLPLHALPAAPAALPRPLAPPANPAMMNKRPRRTRRPANAVLDFGIWSSGGISKSSGTKARHGFQPIQLNARALPELPPAPPAGARGHEPWRHPGFSRKRTIKPLAGLEYGPRNTCAVDTFLTLLHHALTPAEKMMLKRLGGVNEAPFESVASSGPSSPASTIGTSTTVGFAAAAHDSLQPGGPPSEAERTPTIQALFSALRALSHGNASVGAKSRWYAHLCAPCSPDEDEDGEAVDTLQVRQPGLRGPSLQRRAARVCPPPGEAAKAPQLECVCQCPCANCEAGLCVKCGRCKCTTPCLMGHCFGVMEQFFNHLLPPGLADSPFHFRSRSMWQCEQYPQCPYRYTALSTTAHLPLLLSAPDVAELLQSGVPPEVGALAAAHLARAPYDYGTCPQCAAAPLCARATEATFSPLMIVELGRLDGGVAAGAGAPGRLPWTPCVAPACTFAIGAARQEYHAVAIVYNDGAHWWADMLSSSHFKRRKGPNGERGEHLGVASYRYDGLEADGRLRFCGYRLTMTSDPCHVSLVIYRKAPGKAPSR